LKTRILLTGLAAVAAMAFSASSASAATVGPAGQFAAVSSNAVFEVGSTPIGYECSSSVLRGSVTAAGAIQGGALSFSGCGGTFSTTSITAKEVVGYEVAFDSKGLNTTVRKINLAFSSSSCKFNVTGYESTTNLGSSPLRLAEWVFPSTSGIPATLTVSSVNPEGAHCFGLVTPGAPVKFKSTYKLSPTLTVTK
jgi:hypothetical protein